MKDQNLFNVRQESGKTIVEITDLSLLRRAFGDDLIVAFCRSFVWTDRLMSMNFLGIQVAGLDSTSVRFGREMHTMLWFTCGCLRELARALEALLSTSVEGFLEPAKLTLLEEVRETLVRWNTDSFFTLVRDKVGFHVDSDLLSRGLEKLAASTNMVVFMENDSPGMGFTRVSFAHELLNAGLFASGDEEQEELSQVKDRIAQFVNAVQNDHGRVATLLEHILIGCIEGTEAGRTRRPTAATPKPSTESCTRTDAPGLAQGGQGLGGLGREQDSPGEGCTSGRDIAQVPSGAQDVPRSTQALATFGRWQWKRNVGGV